jgi:hypothetical protein
VSSAIDDFGLTGLFAKRERLLHSIAAAATNLALTQEGRIASIQPEPAAIDASPSITTSLAHSCGRPRVAAIAYFVAVLITITSGALISPRQPTTSEWDHSLVSAGRLDHIVDRIIAAETGGGNRANGRSTADGPAQFLADTWLELLRTYRPDLTKGRSRAELLSMRRDAKLARDMTKRFLQRHAAMLQRRNLPVTASTLYLAHFAGGAGAVAVLSAPRSADAALVLARADASGSVTRAKIVAANPFLAHYTVADLEEWANRKVGNRTSRNWLVRVIWDQLAAAFSGSGTRLSCLCRSRCS